MKTNQLLLAILFSVFSPVLLSGFTGPSNLTVSKITCSAARISWNPGAFKWSLLILREDSEVNATPVNGSYYAGNTTFKQGTHLGNGNYSIAANSNFSADMIGFVSGKKYFIAVYTYDSASNFTYETTNVATGSFTVGLVNLDFSISYSDSCQNTNTVKCINKSNITTITPTLSWTFFNELNEYRVLYGDTVEFTFTKSGNKNIQLYNSTKGCTVSITKNVFIYARNLSTPKIAGTDTLVCFDSVGSRIQVNENFHADLTPGAGFTRFWKSGDEEYSGLDPWFNLKQSGVNKILYIGKGLYHNKIKCIDTTWLSIRVRPAVPVDLGPDLVWKDTTTSIVLNAAKFNSYYWFNKSTSSTFKVVKSMLPKYRNVFWVRVTDSLGCMGTDSVIIYNLAALGLNQQHANQFMLYPSPVHDVFYIDTKDNVVFEFAIYTALGKLVYQGNAHKGVEISTMHIPSGFYTIKLKGNGFESAQALLIQH